MKKLKFETYIFLSLLFVMLLSLFITTIKYNLYSYDAISIFFYVLAHSFLRMLDLVAPVLVISVAIYAFHHKLKTGNIKYHLTRKSYKNYMKANILKAYKYAMIVPITIFIMFIICCIINHQFDFEKAFPRLLDGSSINPVYESGISVINSKFYNTPILLMLTFFSVLVLHCIFYANIGLILCKKNKNMLVTILSAFLVFIALAILSQSFELYIITSLNLPFLTDVFNFLGIWIYCDFQSLLPIFLYALFLAITSFIILILSYKNKEKVIIYSEK